MKIPKPLIWLVVVALTITLQIYHTRQGRIEHYMAPIVSVRADKNRVIVGMASWYWYHRYGEMMYPYDENPVTVRWVEDSNLVALYSVIDRKGEYVEEPYVGSIIWGTPESTFDKRAIRDDYTTWEEFSEWALSVKIPQVLDTLAQDDSIYVSPLGEDLYWIAETHQENNKLITHRMCIVDTNADVLIAGYTTWRLDRSYNNTFSWRPLGRCIGDSIWLYGEGYGLIHLDDRKHPVATYRNGSFEWLEPK